MRFIRFASLFLMFVSASLSSRPLFAQGNNSANANFEWALRIGSRGDDAARGVATDSQGNLYVVGSFPGTVQVGATTLTSRGDDDFFLLKLTPDGAVIWVEQFGGTSSDRAYDVAVDTQDYPVITGWFGATVTFGETTLTSTGRVDGFTARLNPDGDVLWVRQITGASLDDGNEIATSPNGNILVAGNTRGSAAVDDIALPNQGEQDGFIVVYDQSGQVMWVQPVSATGFDQMRGIYGDADNNVLVAGQFAGQLSIGGQTLQSAGGSDSYLAKFDPAGNLLWVRQYGGSGDDLARGVSADGEGNVYTSGTFSEQVTFGNLSLESRGAADVFVLKVNADGIEQWVQQVGGTTEDGGCEIDVRADGSVYIAGEFTGTTRIGSETLTSVGSADLFMVRFDTNGNVLWVLSAGGRRADIHYALAVDPAGDVITTGTVRLQPRFGEIVLADDAGETDMFVTKISN
jgi:hypothetical protein